MLTIALAKGRLSKYAATLFKNCGLNTKELTEDTRKLVIDNAKDGVRYVFVKPSDVPVYVHRGTADIGIAGKDTLLEAGLPLYEMLDLKFGACRLCLAGFPERYNANGGAVMRIATKYPRITRLYFNDMGRDVDIIKLNGSIELAPLLGLSDAIMDIVESGSTLRENGLSVIQEVCPVSARLVVNQVSLKTKADVITPLIEKIRQSLEHTLCS